MAARESCPDEVYLLDTEMCILEELRSGCKAQFVGKIYGRYVICHIPNDDDMLI